MSVVLRLEPLGACIRTKPGARLWDLLLPFGVEFPCGGNGRCRRCRVRVLDGEVEGPVEDGWALACHSTVIGDATIDIGQFDAPVLADDRPFAFTPREGCGVAIDLGTTTVVAQLADLRSGVVLGVRTALN